MKLDLSECVAANTRDTHFGYSLGRSEILTISPITEKVYGCDVGYPIQETIPEEQINNELVELRQLIEAVCVLQNMSLYQISLVEKCADGGAVLVLKEGRFKVVTRLISDLCPQFAHFTAFLPLEQAAFILIPLKD